MYYLMMKIAFKPDLQSKTLSNNRSFNFPIEKETIVVDSKFYQKLFIVLISLSTILIFPESQRELENICESYNSSNQCKVW